ncbi:hypothetical protein QAD02_010184 [Eretmocerus hayati]|uniref:Uncharacterized protein n=1 Tax=Eretmocerus hayati TaxID=131215 RepID=A0ACC2NC66_9HYME|nr:hypothetical protein QAD02_010184 [Eretmocerus hayati]
MSSGFISESKIAEQRKLRQEEWERVRSSDQPLEAPEAPYDPRCLYDRLQEQKNKKEAEYEEAHKLKNMIKGLDDDEVEFLDLVDRTKMEEERKKNIEEEKELKDFKAAVASFQEKSLEESLKLELKKPQTNKSTNFSNKNSQLKLLAGAIVKKSSKTENGSQSQGSKRKLSESEDTHPEKNGEEASSNKVIKTSDALITSNSELQEGALKCVGILPGLGSYSCSSDSDSSSDSEYEQPGCHQKRKDMLGRPVVEPPPPSEGEK